jgi:hypothetical protein
MKPPPLHFLEQIWVRLRRPFRYPKGGHECKWERFDADRAGCVLCGKLHKCSNGLAECTCPLAESEEGGHVCLITGLCIPEVRVGNQYVDHVMFENTDYHKLQDEAVYERVYGIVYRILSSNPTIACKQMEKQKFSQKRKQILWRILKNKKKMNPYQLPCMLNVVSELAKELPQCPLANSQNACLETLVQKCTANITNCIAQIHRMGYKKIYHGTKFQGIVIGMLYMSRVGLRVGDIFNLHAIAHLDNFLPSETYLSMLGISNKVICDSENEIKLCIRAFYDAKSNKV